MEVSELRQYANSVILSRLQCQSGFFTPLRMTLRSTDTLPTERVILILTLGGFECSSDFLAAKTRHPNPAMGTTQPLSLIDIRSVTKAYETAAGDFIALNNVDLKVSSGEFVAVVGKSGSGKSTLSNMITGIDRPTSGEVFVNGTPVHTLSEGQTAVWRGKTIGVVFQFFQLLPTLTVLENVMIPMDFCNIYRRNERKDVAVRLLDQVEMTEHMHKLPTAISGGQQQRVAIARAMANDPPLIVADEPTGNLDSKTSDSVFALFEELVSNGKTILMVTHDEDLAKRVSRTLTIADGEIVGDDLRAPLSAAYDDLEDPQTDPTIWIPQDGVSGIPATGSIN